MNPLNKIQNSFKVKSHCDKLLKIDSLECLTKYREEHFFEQTVSILGAGYNIIPRTFVDGLVINSNLTSIDIIENNEKYVSIKVGSGVIWDNFVKYTTDHGYVGLENLSLIPSSVGAAPVQNIGAYGAEASTFIDSVHCYNLKTGQFLTLNNAECAFDYRTSYFKSNPELFICYVTFKLCKSNLIAKSLTRATSLSKSEYVTDSIKLFALAYKSVNLKLNPRPKIKFNFSSVRDILMLCVIPASVKRKIVVYIRTKTLHSPDKIGNCGCFFKCPILPYSEFESLKRQYPTIEWFEHDRESVKISACWLMKNTNWAGKTLHNVRTDSKRPVVLLNAGNASGEDVMVVMNNIQQDIKSKFNIDLEAEVVTL